MDPQQTLVLCACFINNSCLKTYPIPNFYGIALSTFASAGYSFYAAIFMLKVLNKWFWQINDVLYFSFDIQANYNILNKIIIYFSTDNCLALPIRIVWKGSQKAFKFTGGGIYVQILGLCSGIQIQISMHIG